MTPEQQQAVYDQLTQLVRDNLTDDFDIHEAPGKLDVDTRKPITINGREKPNVNLLSVVIQKRHVGFYFMPVYINTTLRDDLPESLAKMLKGKSCFHCKKELPPERKDEFAQLIQSGIAFYQEKEWV